MTTYVNSDGVQLGAAQLPALFPNTSWEWGKPLPADLAAMLGLTLVADPPAPVPTLLQKQQALLDQLEPQRLVRQNAGLVYTFKTAVLASDSATVASPAIVGTIQTRDQTQFPDIANINGETTDALILQSFGITAAVLSFRVEENVTYPMTPTEMISMGLAVSAFISSTYAAKWAIQIQINNLTDANVDSFDITQGWPA